MAKEYSLFQTDWGYMAAVWSDFGLWELSFPRPTQDEAMADIKTTDLVLVNEHACLPQLVDELKLYFQGFTVEFGVPVDWRGYTQFQAAVLRHTSAIAYGQVLTYGEVAQAVGSPKAARAVGGALHINRTPLVVPCHRVIGSNGSLTGFGGGLDMKKALLLLEQAQETV